MTSHRFLTFLVSLSASWLTLAGAETLQPAGSYPLAMQLYAADCNFHPQGLGFDETTGELLFIQQCTNTIYRTDQTGTIVGSRTIGTLIYNPGGATVPDANHTTSVAADAGNYYFSDYTNNSTGFDVYIIDRGAGAALAFSTEVAAYGGYPIDIRAGKLYRTNVSTTYDWSTLNQVRISDMSAVDSILQTVTLAGTNGIGDIAVDLDGNNIWAVDYVGSSAIHQYDIATGALKDTFPLGLDGLTAGLTYGQGKLFHYYWNYPGGNATLTVFDVLRSAAVRTVDATPTVVTQGSTGNAVGVDVENVGTTTLNVTAVTLSFTGTADRTSEYTVTPAPGNPTTIAPATTAHFDFAVAVSLTATPETITIDAAFAGIDTGTSGVVTDSASDVTDTWDVLACAATLCGDCNQDGAITILDALVAAQHAAALITLAGIAFTNCNVIGAVEPDPMAAVDILDALSLAQAAAGLVVTLVCC